MDPLEHRTLETKFATGEAGLVSGYASLFGKPADAVNDLIAPGAFSASLAAHAAAGTLPAMLREHGGEPVGQWLEVVEDELGLRVKGRIDLATPAGRDAYEAVRQGAVDGLSIGYRAEKAERSQDGQRTLFQIDLHEISFVRRPASSRARVLSVKSAGGSPSAGNPAAMGAAHTQRKTMDKQTTAPGGDPGSATVEDRINTLEETVGGFDARLLAVKSVADRIEAKLNRPGATAETKAEPGSIETKAFGGYLRHGRELLASDEAKSLRIADDTSGGYLAPAGFVAEVIKKIVQVSPVRQAAKIGATASNSVILPKRTAAPTAVWVGETETRTEAGSTYGQTEIPIHEQACFVDVSLRLLEDAAINVEAEVSADLAEEFGRLEGNAFVVGNGVKKPLGFMTDSGVSYSATGNASTLGSAPADLLITVMYAMPAFYRNTGVWMMNGNTLAAIRKLKDGQSNYLWQPSYQAGQPETILGRPVIEAPDMADVGSAAEPIVFGDFGRAFRIYDRLNLSVMRDPYSQATTGLVRFHARRRVGGAVVLSEAIRKIRCATS